MFLFFKCLGTLLNLTIISNRWLGSTFNLLAFEFKCLSVYIHFLRLMTNIINSVPYIQTVC